MTFLDATPAPRTADRGVGEGSKTASGRPGVTPWPLHAATPVGRRVARDGLGVAPEREAIP